MIPKKALMEPRQIIHELSSIKRLPVEAICAADANRATMVPLFIGEIERYLAGQAGDQRVSNLLFFIFHMLGSWREKSAYRVLARFLRDPGIDVILGDATTETTHEVMAAVFDGDPQPLYELILDPNADQYVRSHMCMTVAMVVRFGDLARAEAARFLRVCYDDLRPTHDCSVWDGWQSAVAMLGLVEMKDLVEQAFERELIDPSWLRFKDFEEDLSYSIEHPDSPPCLHGRELVLFGDTIARMSRWGSFSEQDVRGDLLRLTAEHRRQIKDLKRERDGLLLERDRLQRQYDERQRKQALARLEGESVPASGNFASIGRNEPCPCGSGRKFKKCCLDRVRDADAMRLESVFADKVSTRS